jgi:O-antigen/teichoic acid export membrane protein
MPLEQPLDQPAPLAPLDQPRQASGVFKNLIRETLSRAREHHAAFYFTGASVLVSFGSMLAATFTMRWISPEDLGLWNSIRLALTYAVIALAGINNGLSRELPYFFGKSDESTAKRLASTTLFYVSAAGLLVSIGGIVSALVFRHHGHKVVLAIFAVTPLIILSFYTNYLIVTYRSSKSFRDFSKIKIGEAFITVATIPLVAYLGYNGMLMRAVVLAAVVVVMMHLLRPVRVTPSWHTDSFALLLKTGMPIFVLDYISTSASTCDRLVLLHLGGIRDVGFFALALMAREAIGIVPGALSEYIYPRMSYSYGSTNDPLQLWRMAVKSSLLVVAFMIPTVAVGWFMLPPLVSRLFPKYTMAVESAQWLLIASIFSAATLGRMAIWSMKDWKFMTWYQLLGSVIVIAGPIIGGLSFSKPLAGVTAGVVAGQIIWCPIAWYLIYLATHPGTSEGADRIS